MSCSWAVSSTIMAEHGYFLEDPLLAENAFPSLSVRRGTVRKGIAISNVPVGFAAKMKRIKEAIISRAPILRLGLVCWRQQVHLRHIYGKPIDITLGRVWLYQPPIADLLSSSPASLLPWQSSQWARRRRARAPHVTMLKTKLARNRTKAPGLHPCLSVSSQT